VITTSDFKKGLRILIEGDPYTILESIVQTPSARGASSLAKVKVRNLKTGQVFDRTFRTGEKFPEPDLERRPLQYLYGTGEHRVFLDMQSFEQIEVTDEELGDDARFLSDGLELKALFFEDAILELELPATMEFEVVDVEPGSRGDTVHGGATKPAVLNNGLKVAVPLFIQPGERIRVSTKDGKFAERAK
jgi:elongation factor P